MELINTTRARVANARGQRLKLALFGFANGVYQYKIRGEDGIYKLGKINVLH